MANRMFSRGYPAKAYIVDEPSSLDEMDDEFNDRGFPSWRAAPRGLGRVDDGDTFTRPPARSAPNGSAPFD